MMKKYIDQDMLCDFANNHLNNMIDSNDIMRFPVSDVEEVKHAKWIYVGHNLCIGFRYECSICKRALWAACDQNSVVKEYPYCHCGAKMQSVEVDQ